MGRKKLETGEKKIRLDIWVKESDVKANGRGNIKKGVANSKKIAVASICAYASRYAVHFKAKD